MKDIRSQCAWIGLLGAALLLVWAVPADNGIAGSAGQIAFAYDQAGRLVQATYSDGTTITYAYDANGNLTERKVSAPPPKRPHRRLHASSAAPVPSTGGVGMTSAAAAGRPASVSPTGSAATPAAAVRPTQGGER
jgi:YD repeat-containing protein